MTIFEIIILGIIYLFCLSFSIEMLMETKCVKFERVVLFLLILMAAPLFTVFVIGAFTANIINNSME